jgi:SAM-dependent methyltransferase
MPHRQPQTSLWNTPMSTDPRGASRLSPHPQSNFLQLYGHLPLSQLVADWQETPLTAEDEVWVNLPPDDFMHFVRSYPATPFDSIPPSTNYIKDPTFLVSQAHRIWLTTSLTHTHLMSLNARHFLDLGSFPFFNALVLRDYFGFNGDITVTTNIDLSEAGYSLLESKRIRIEKVDLDPYVSDPASETDRLPARMGLTDGSVDLVLSSHVIEHLYHPRVMNDECGRLLRENGRYIVSTDNAMMIDVFANYIGGYGYIFEPVEHTAAMHFDFWRGHVRFFTSKDLETMLERSGFSVIEANFSQCFYDVLFEEYFKTPVPQMSGWKRKLLAETPWLRNDIAVVGEKTEFVRD